MFTKKRTLAVIGTALALGLVTAACGGDDDDDAASTTTTGSAMTSDATSDATTVAPAEGTLDASGATFPKAFYEEAIAAFKKDNPKATVNYAGGGSGKGRQDLADEVVDFAGTDSPVKDEDLASYKGGEILHFPTVVAPIAVAFNLDGIDELNLTADVIAKVFQRQITKWNDPAIAAENAGVTLPDLDITVAHRSDSSGTTDNFSKFLVAGAPDTWKLKSGSTIEWPADTQAGQGNAGVTQVVSQTKGAIGYIDFSDARAAGLKLAAVENKAGKYVLPSLDGASAAAAGAVVNDDLTYFPGWADGDAAYPIAAATWIIVYKDQPDAATAAVLKAFLTWVLTDGQELAPEVDFAPLAPALAQKALAQVDTIS